MWKILLLLVAANAVSGNKNATTTTSCRVLIHEECDIENLLPDDVPGTKEEFYNVCSLALGYFVCANNVLENCSRDSDLTDHFELEQVFKRVCDKDYIFHDALIDSLPCLKRNRVLITSCPTFHGERKENFIRALAEIGIVDVASPDTQPIHCLSTLYNNGCYASNTGKICSNEAKDVLLDVIQSFRNAFSFCRPGVKESIRDISELIDTDRGEGEN